MAKSEKKPRKTEHEETQPASGQPRAPRWYERYYGGLWGAAIVWLLRLVVGGVFVFSGFTKGIDPWGSIYKFGEYLHSFGFYGYDDLLTFMAFSVSVIEFMLGVFMVLGIYRRFTPWAMMAMMVVMLPLTLYIAATDSVADCGCFGDAVTLSNWGTFFKNIFLTIALFYLIIFNSRVKNIYGFAVQWIVALLTFLFIMVVGRLGYIYQPLLDFRPYPVGTYVAGESHAAVDDDDYVFIYEKEGVRQEFTLDSLPDETWSFVDRKIESTAADTEVKPAVKQRAITVFDADYHEADGVIRADGEQLLLLFPALDEVVIPFSSQINDTYDFCHMHGIDVVGITSNSKEDIDEWIDLSMAAYPMYVMDDSELKMVARGNPAAVFLRDGVVVWKCMLSALPISLDEAESLDEMEENFTDKEILYILLIIYLVAMIVVLIINRMHTVVKFSLRSLRKSRKKEVNLQPENDSKQ